MLGPEDQPAIHLNDELMDEARPQMEKFYYDPAKYDTHLDQLGISYPSGIMKTPPQSKGGPVLTN